MKRFRLCLKVPVVATGPIHLGGKPEEVSLQDRFDGQELHRAEKDEREAALQRCYRSGNTVTIPGSSVAGAIRSVIYEAGLLEESLWGSLREASVIRTEDCVFSDLKTTDMEERDGNALDRFTGSAGDTALFRFEVIPPGTGFEIELRAACDENQVEAVKKQFGHVVDVIDDGRLSFGGRNNAGWGLVGLDSERPATLDVKDLASFDGLRSELGQAVSKPEVITPNPQSLTGGLITIKIDWKPSDGFMLGDGDDGPDASGRKNVNRSKKSNGNYVLTGSSLRGALRTRAARIANTVLAASGKAEDISKIGVHEQLASEPDLVKMLFGSTEWAGILGLQDSFCRNHKERRREHVVIDRWTGGAISGVQSISRDANQSGRLFTDVEVIESEWDPLVLRINLARIKPEYQDAMRASLCLLLLTLAELSSGTLPLGGQTNRGLGDVTVSQVDWDCPLGLDWLWNDSAKAETAVVLDATSGSVADGLLKLAKAIEPSDDSHDGWYDFLEEDFFDECE